MKTKKLKINKYAQFENQEIDFGNFTVISGANGTGKTNLFSLLKIALITKNKDYEIITEGKQDTQILENMFPTWGGSEERIKRFVENKNMRQYLNIKEMLTGKAPDESEIDKYLSKHLLLSKGERWMTYIEEILVYREIHGINDPLILDAPFECLDKELVKVVIGMLKLSNSQIIIFEKPNVLENFNSKANYDLKPIDIAGRMFSEVKKR